MSWRLLPSDRLVQICSRPLLRHCYAKMRRNKAKKKAHFPWPLQVHVSKRRLGQRSRSATLALRVNLWRVTRMNGRWKSSSTTLNAISPTTSNKVSWNIQGTAGDRLSTLECPYMHCEEWVCLRTDYNRWFCDNDVAMASYVRDPALGIFVKKMMRDPANTRLIYTSLGTIWNWVWLQRGSQTYETNTVDC